MTADKEFWCSRWVARHLAHRHPVSKSARPRRRRHAGLVLELALMMVLVALLPGGKKRR